MLYHNGEVWATDRALRALHQGFLLVDPWRQSPSYVHRLVKYARRYGLAIVDPAMDQGLLLYSDGCLPSMMESLKKDGSSGISKWQGLAQLLILHSDSRNETSSLEQYSDLHNPTNAYTCMSLPPTLAFCLTWLAHVRSQGKLPDLTGLGAHDSKSKALWWRHAAISRVIRFPRRSKKPSYDYHEFLPEALSQLQYMLDEPASQQLLTGSFIHQPYMDWYAHIQQLVNGGILNNMYTIT